MQTLSMHPFPSSSFFFFLVKISITVILSLSHSHILEPDFFCFLVLQVYRWKEIWTQGRLYPELYFCLAFCCPVTKLGLSLCNSFGLHHVPGFPVLRCLTQMTLVMEFGTFELMRFRMRFYTLVDFVISENFGYLSWDGCIFMWLEMNLWGQRPYWQAEQWTFKDVHVLTSQSYEYVTLQDKREFADMINLKDIEKEIILNYLSGSQSDHKSTQG